MAHPHGLRERKKAAQRQRLADVAANLFASRGYDEVSIADVAVAADVSYQTVYNYFPAKQDLALDRADALRDRYREAVSGRAEGVSPAAALRPLVLEGIDRYRRSDLRLDRGEHPALCVGSVTFRGFALLSRELDACTIADAITQTCPWLPQLTARAHAAALVAVLQAMTDRVGKKILEGDVSDIAAADMERDALAALSDLEIEFRSLVQRYL